jgi:urocanate hydratase
MPTHPTLPPAFAFISQVERFYAGLISAANPGPEPSLGGKLFYAGELDTAGRAMVVAANIAGAATLTASADPMARKQAIRDGVVDFLVTSLDEALRILKNELRQRQTGAVAVALAPGASEADFAGEMRRRGVAPDLLRPAAAAEPPRSGNGREFLVAFSVPAAPARWLPKLDAMAADCLGPEDGQARRWLRLAPRYLGRLAQGMRLLRCNQKAAANFAALAEQAQLGVAVEIFAPEGQSLDFPSGEPPASTG